MIQNIIFDFGDIFIDLDKSATANAMTKHGFSGITDKLQHLFESYERGQTSTPGFLAAVGKMFPTASQQDLIAAWNAILLGFPEERLVFLEQLAQEKRYRLFLLSNTNELHIEHVGQKMGNKDFERFKNCFEGFYISHEINLRKPDLEIFEYVLKKNGLEAKETFFVDDTRENVDAAARLGIKVWHLQVGQQDIVQLNQFLP